MKKIALLQKSAQRPPRRSTRRLGDAPQVMENRVSALPLTSQPALTYWHIHQSRILGAAVLLMCLWIIYLLFATETFYISAANIEGNRILTAQEIYSAAQIDALSIFWVNPKTVQQNIEAMTNIKSARVNVTLPANVTITIEERRPEIVWQTGQIQWWIDSEGLVVPPRPTETENNQTRLRITDLDNKPVKEKDQISLSIVQGAQLVHHQKPEIVDLFYSQTHGLSYFSPEGWIIYLGDAANIPAKLASADAMRADLQIRGVTPGFIDVRNPLRAVYQEVNSATF